MTTAAVSVLIVENEKLIRDNLREALEEAGFNPVVKTTGGSAISELDAHWKNYHALITDIRLGNGPCGWDVARHARELNPEIPVVYITSDSKGEWASQGVPESVLISKPFALAQIVSAVSTLLNQTTV